MRTDGLGSTAGSHRHVRNVEGDLAGVAQQPGLGVAGVDAALDPDGGGDMRLPVGAGQRVGRIEDGDGAALVAVAALVVAMGSMERCRGGRDLLDCLMQGRLVAPDPDDQGYVGGCRDGEKFLGSARRRA